MSSVTKILAARGRVFLGLCICTGILYGCGSDLTDAEYVQKARELQTAGDYKAAAIEVKNALGVNDGNVEARFMLANYNLREGGWASAEKEYLRALELGIQKAKIIPGLARAYINQGKFAEILQQVTPEPDYSADLRADIAAYRGRALIGTDNTMVAEREIRLALELAPLNPVAGLATAQLRITEGDYESAKRIAAEFLAANPTDGDLSRMVAQMEGALGNIDAAIEAYGKTIEIRLDNAIDFLGRGLLMLQKGELYNAEANLLEAKKRLSKHPQVYYGLGVAEFYRQRYPEAQLELEQAVEFAPRYMPAIYHLGLAHYLQSNYEQAGRYMAQFLAANPTSPTASRILAVIANANDDPVKVEELLRPIAEAYPEDIAAAAVLSRALISQGKLAEGGEFLAQAAAQDPESLEAQVSLGLAAVLKGDLDTGIEHLLEARKLDPDSILIDTLIASAYLAAKDFDKAIEFATIMDNSGADKKPAASYLTGVAYLGKEMDAEAIASLQEATRLQPDFLQPRVLLAHIFEENGDLDKAIAEYSRGMEYHPQNAGVMLALARLYTLGGDFEAARKQFEKAREANLEALSPRLFLASYYYDQGDLERAEELMDEAAKYHADAPAFLVAKGKFELKQGQPEKAVSSFEALLRTTANRAEANYLLARALAAVNQPGRAKKHLKLAADADSDYVAPRLALARTLLAENDPEGASKLLVQLEELAPENLEVVALRGSIALVSGEYDAAIATFTSLSQETGSSVVIVDLAKAYFLSNDWQKSIDLQEKWLQANPGDLAVAVNLAQTYAILKKNSEAIRVYELVVKNDPDNILALGDLAWLLQDSDIERALTLAQHANSLKNDFAPILDTMAVLYLEKKQARKAMDYAQRAIRLEPGNLDYKFHLARIHLALGEREEAKSILEDITSTGLLFSELVDAQSTLQDLE